MGVQHFPLLQVCATDRSKPVTGYFQVWPPPPFFLYAYARLQTGRIMVWWCPSVRPGLRPSVSPSQFSALFSYMLWHIFLKFCVSLYFYARKIKFECHQFPSLFAGVMLLFNFKLLQISSFPHFSPTCFDILSSNFVYDFVLMYQRASLSVVILQQFLLELCLFLNLEYSKYSVFRTFLLHALTYWSEILHMTLFYCTTDQVRVSSICVNFCGSYAPFYTPVFRRDVHVLWSGDVRPGLRPSVRPSQFSALFYYMLWHIDLKFCVSLHFYARKIKFECHQFPSLFTGVMLLFNFKLLQICSFPHFSPTCFDILSSNFVYDFV